MQVNTPMNEYLIAFGVKTIRWLNKIKAEMETRPEAEERKDEWMKRVIK
jgi:hypothetical protein